MNEKAELFYDGSCGLCHRTVSFILKRGERGETFRFAPLGGETYYLRTTPEQRAVLPDSVVVLTASGGVLTRSRAILHILKALGGGWRRLGWIGQILPRRLADALYDGIARNRHRLAPKPSETCPPMSQAQRLRFDP